MNQSRKMFWCVLFLLLAGGIMMAGCTSTTPVTKTETPTGPASVATQATQASGQSASVPPAQGTTPDDAKFSQAVINAINDLNPILVRVGDNAQALDVPALQKSGAELSTRADVHHKTISVIVVSPEVQPVKDNFLNALLKFKDAGSKIDQGTVALNKGDMENGSRLLTEAADAITSGTEYLNLTGTAASKL